MEWPVSLVLNHKALAQYQMLFRYSHAQCYGSGSSILSVSGSNPDPRLRWPKIKEKQLKSFFLFFIKNWNLLILRTLKRTSKQQEKPSALKREHLALQTMILVNFFNFFGSFLPSWIRIRITNPSPDPGTSLNSDPDPQPWSSQGVQYKTQDFQYILFGVTILRSYHTKRTMDYRSNMKYAT